MKKILSIALVLMFAFSVLAGCGSTTPAASGSPAASAAAGASTGSSAGGTIKVGFLGPLTGEAAQYGIAVQHGAQLYIDKVNDAGGINGKKIEVIAYDDKADATESVNAFTRLVDNGITALIGPVTSKATIAVVGEALPLSMPMITASATAADVTVNPTTKAVNTNVFRTCFIDPFQGQKMADYASQILKAKTAAIIYRTGDDYSTGLKDAFKAECAKVGITITNEEGYSKGDKDFKSQLTNMSAKNPDVIFSPNYYEDDGMIVTQARQVGLKSTFMGGDGWGGVAKYASAADLQNSVYSSGYASGSTDEIKAFEKAFTAKYAKETPDMFSAQGYDAAIVMLDALKTAEGKGLKAGSDDYKKAVIAAMKSTSSVGLGGAYKFDEFNNPVKGVVIMKVSEGKETFSQMF